MKDRLEAKESYIRLFPKWGWIIGTGIYDKEVKDEIAVIRGYFVQVSFAIVFIVLLLLIYLVRNGLKIETLRRKTEILLHESIERAGNHQTQGWKLFELRLVIPAGSLSVCR